MARSFGAALTRTRPKRFVVPPGAYEPSWYRSTKTVGFFYTQALRGSLEVAAHNAI
ncbi:MAG: hypothetical protein AW12_02430 [Candidatus Accumulibacter sp. BA-94]|nr:MAG: hypothetical protein AW12_02430 [Candidatus Accumulibacter sp. BA-94]